MSSYRPIVDGWILARPKVRYYGAYPGGFLERARRLLGVSLDDPVLHVCGGKVRDYPYYGGVGPNDKTLDLDANVFPDYIGDVRKLDAWPHCSEGRAVFDARTDTPLIRDMRDGWKAILMDPPYTEQDARHYLPGAFQFPKLSVLMKHAQARLRVGGRVGVLHYEWPAPPPLVDGIGLREVAVASVYTGRRQRARVFTVWEKQALTKAARKAREVLPVQQALGVEA